MLVNQITELSDLSETGLPTLTTLDLHGNALTSAKNINLPTLQKLYLVSMVLWVWLCVIGMVLQATNQINTLEGLGHLAQLTTLHLRENQLKKLDGLTDQMSSMQYINFRCVEVLITECLGL